MPERDPRCVLALPEQTAAELIAAWLGEKGYGCELVVRPPGLTIEPLTHAAQPEPAEYQVCVLKPEHMEPARELIEEHQAGVAALREREAKRANRTGTVTAVCEDCGKSSDWAAAAMGTTETCPHCLGYMDIPDPDGDNEWSDVDFGAAEEETEEKESEE
jgi:hypothetical protein